MKRTLAYPMGFGLLVLVGGAIAGAAGVEPVIQLQSVSYDEALRAYHDSGRDEIYRCIHKAADGRYNLTAETPVVAIVIDDMMYLRIDGRLLELVQVKLDEKAGRYTTRDARVEAGYSIIDRFNFSEYNESEDRTVALWVKTPHGAQRLKAIGSRCGI